MARYVVTGGAGFLGRALGIRLRALGHEVVSVSRGRYPELKQYGIEHVSCDLGDDHLKLMPIFSGAEAVFHTAAYVKMWGRYLDFYRGNVLATRNVISACNELGISKLIFTSSPSVIADGNELCGIDESYPYPQDYLAHYPMTKAQAERDVLAANGKDGLRTVVLRPHLIFGPGDTNLVPTILARARAGRLVQVGNGENLVDFSYIEDCVEAHLLAERALSKGPAAGRVYFISQGDPVRLWNFINKVLRFNNLPSVKRKIAKGLAMKFARLFEVAARAHIIKEPLFTRFLVSEMATSHYFNIAAAKRDLGYVPQYSVEQGLRHCFAQPASAFQLAR